jgi:hypothetical protein
MKRLLLGSLLFLAVCSLPATAAPNPFAGAYAHPIVKEESLRAAVIDEPAIFPQVATTHSVTLNWTASTDAAGNPTLSYNVFRLIGACSATAAFTKINTTPVTATTFVDSGIAPGAYCYQATSFLNGAESKPSNQVAAVILPLPPGSVVVSAAN